jgi:peptide/nickel transport system substrate-binding protein
MTWMPLTASSFLGYGGRAWHARRNYAPKRSTPLITRRRALQLAAAVTSIGFLPDLSFAANGKVFVAASLQDIPSFDPHVATGYSTLAVLRNVYDSLVSVVGSPVRVEPKLAQSWTTSEDGKTYEFKLNPGAAFSDGTPVTAEDVRYSFARLLRIRKGNAWMLASVLAPENVVAVDPATVRITLNEPFAAFLLVLLWVFIANKAQVEANLGNDDAQTWLRSNVVGSGGFVLGRHEPGALFEMLRSPKRWKDGGNLDAAIWRVVRETATQRLLIQSGEVHAALDLTAEDIEALKGAPGIVTVVQPELRTFSIKMNTGYGPLADVNLRKAVSYAFDYDAMLAVAGTADLMVGPLPQSVFGHDDSLVVPRLDIDKAKEHLAKSKVPAGGVKLTVAYVSGNEQFRRFCLVLLEALRSLNIELDIKPVVWPDLVALAAKPDTTPDFFPIFQQSSYPDPDNTAFPAYHSSGNGGWSNPTYHNPTVDELIVKARQTLDVAKRTALYAELQRVIVGDAPDIFGVLDKRRLAFSDKVQNYEFTPVAGNSLDFQPLSLA